jgi:hypothetical protein
MTEGQTYYVSPAQAKGWQHPAVTEILCDLKEEVSDAELEHTLARVVIEGGFMGGFLPLPFTKDSESGQRLLAAWEVVKGQYSNKVSVTGFNWKFWHPERDLIDASILPNDAINAATAVEQAMGVVPRLSAHL